MIKLKQEWTSIKITITHDYAQFPGPIDILWNIHRYRDSAEWTHGLDKLVRVQVGKSVVDILSPEWFDNYSWQVGDELDVILFVRYDSTTKQIDRSQVIIYRSSVVPMSFAIPLGLGLSSFMGLMILAKRRRRQ